MQIYSRNTGTQYSRASSPIQGNNPASAKPIPRTIISSPAIAADSKIQNQTILAAVRDLMPRYDLTNITPNQLGQLGGTLFEQGYISQDTAAIFISTEGDTVGEDPDRSFNAIAHFQFMLNLVNETANQPGGNFMGLAQQYYTDALCTVIHLNGITNPSQPTLPLHSRLLQG